MPKLFVIPAILLILFLLGANCLDGKPGEPGTPGGDAPDAPDATDQSPNDPETTTILPPTGLPTSLSSTTPPPVYTKMIKIYGTVTSSTSTRRKRSVEDVTICINQCYDSGTCILAYLDTSNECKLYYYTPGTTLTIEETTEDDSEVVAFKANLDAFKCPLDFRNNASYEIISNDNVFVIPINWTKTTTGWQIIM